MQLRNTILTALDVLNITPSDRANIEAGGALFGEAGILDSHGFLSLCVAIEEALEEQGIHIDAIGCLTDSSLQTLKTLDDFSAFFCDVQTKAA